MNFKIKKKKEEKKNTNMWKQTTCGVCCVYGQLFLLILVTIYTDGAQ